MFLVRLMFCFFVIVKYMVKRIGVVELIVIDVVIWLIGMLLKRVFILVSVFMVMLYLLILFSDIL